MVAFVVCVAAFVLYPQLVADDTTTAADHPTDASDRNLLSRATREQVASSEIIFVAPARVEGVIAAFHGCNHGTEDRARRQPFNAPLAYPPRADGQDWFVLPEEVQVVHKALEANFAVVALSSSDRSSNQEGNKQNNNK